jgi:hypothetical protein
MQKSKRHLNLWDLLLRRAGHEGFWEPAVLSFELAMIPGRFVWREAGLKHRDELPLLERQSICSSGGVIVVGLHHHWWQGHHVPLGGRSGHPSANGSSPASSNR